MPGLGEDFGDDVRHQIVDLVDHEQNRPGRGVPSVATSRDAIVAEFDGFGPCWVDFVQIERATDGRIAGVVVAEWNADSAQGWLHGPWVDGEDELWMAVGRRLISAAVAQVPPGIEGAVLTGDIDNRLMRDLALELGWEAGEPNHVLVATADMVRDWPSIKESADVRRAMATDEVAIQPLHDSEFPATYFTAGQLMHRAASGEQAIVVAVDADGEVCGYCAGQVLADGDGYIDFLAVIPTVRRSGLARRLTTVMVRDLITRSTTGRVCLTVQEHRLAARSLYSSLGFATEMTMVGYRGTVGH